MNKVSQTISYQIILFCKIVKEILDFAIFTLILQFFISDSFTNVQLSRYIMIIPS